MAKLTLTLIRKRTPDPGRELFVYDDDQRGFGVRIYRSGRKAFFFEYSLPGWRSPKRRTIAQVGDLTLKQARDEARRLRELVAAGVDPAAEREEERTAPTVKDLEVRFMKEHGARRTLATRRNYASLWKRYLLPALRSKRVDEVRWEHLARIHHNMRDKPYMANRMLALASKAWSLAKRWGWYPRELENPARGHDRYAEHRRGRALTLAQLRRIGEALAQEPPDSIQAAALTVTMLTGMRPAEVRRLRWEDLEDGRIIHLPQTKTGPRTAYLGAPAAAIVAEMPHLGPYVFTGRRRDRPMYDLKGVWERVRTAAELPPGLRLYDATRHTFATTAEELGVPEDRRRRLMGHAVLGVHNRYIHPRPEALLADADRVAGAIWAAMGAGPA